MGSGMDNKTKKLALSGMLCGVTMLLTLISLPLPSGYGYINLGDCGVLFGALLLPMGYACAAAGIGGALADLILGYGVYAPATLVIKALTALACSLLLKTMPYKYRLIAMFVAALLVPLGYLAYELIIVGKGAIVNVPVNALQSTIGAVVAYAMSFFIKKTPEA